jgi:hypothetical protein
MSNAKSPRSSWLMVTPALLTLAAFSVLALGQETTTASSKTSGIFEDWSTHHVIFSNVASESFQNGHYGEWLKIVNDSRYVMQQQKRGSAVFKSTLVTPEQTVPPPIVGGGPFGFGGGAGLERQTPSVDRRGKSKPALKKDWSMNDGAVPSASLTITVGTVSGDVSGTSTITVDGQKFTTAAPATATQTGTFTGAPTSGQTVTITSGTNTLTLTVGGPSTATVTFEGEPVAEETIKIGTTTFEFKIGGTGCAAGNICVARSATTTTDAANFEAAVNGNLTNVSASVSGSVVTLTNATAAAISISASNTTRVELNGGTASPVTLAAPTAADGNGCASSTAGTFLNEGTATAMASALAAAISSCNTAHGAVGVAATSAAGTVTVTADAAGTIGNSISLTKGLTNFTWTSGTLSGGTNGPGDSATTFSYWNGNTYDTADQLATDLATAFGDNTTLTAAITPVASSNAVVLTSVKPGSAGDSYTASDANFAAITLSNGGDFSGGANPVLANVFPAKYSFSTTTATCSDYIVFPTSAGGTDATVVAYNNLYANTCTTEAVPNIAWAYNTGGSAALSPILSEDGTQVAYIQISSGVASLVILKPSAGTNNGTVSSPASATSYVPTTYRGCAAPCYTTITLNGSPNVTNSSPFYLYGTADTVYVGDNSGKLHAFTGVFSGTPTEVTAGGWPITVSANVLTSPVYDSTSGNIFVADSGGYLYSYKASNAAHQMSSSKLTYASGTTGIVDGPVIDSSAEKVYVVVGDDANTSTSGSFSCATATGCSGVFQFSATNTTIVGSATACDATSATAWPSGANCGEEAVLGVGSYPNMYDGTFDNVYYNGSGTTGYLWECSPANPGGTDITPRLSAVALQTGGGIVTSGDVIGAGTVTIAISALTSNTSGVACSPVTEFYNTGNPSTVTAINEAGGITAGATGVTVTSSTGIAAGNYIEIGAEDILVTAIAGNTLTIVRGQIGTTAATHADGSVITIPAVDYLYLSVTENGNVTPAALTCTGTSGACLYSIAVGTSAGSHVAGGMAPTNGLGSAGGTTGIVVDNFLTTAGESQIYYSNLGNASCSGNGQTGTSGTASCAVQTSQTAP